MLPRSSDAMQQKFMNSLEVMKQSVRAGMKADVERAAEAAALASLARGLPKRRPRVEYLYTLCSR